MVAFSRPQPLKANAFTGEISNRIDYPYRDNHDHSDASQTSDAKDTDRTGVRAAQRLVRRIPLRGAQAGDFASSAKLRE